ncbi:MAG: restriction endonuclease subunit S [bacterium]|nr:restriction endonuclease subunit S [bacterium]
MNDEMPPGWAWATFGDVSNVVGGATPKTKIAANWGDDVSWITPDDLSHHSGMYIDRGRRSLTREGYESCSAQLMPAGSVLFTSRAPIGYVAISSGPVCTNQGFKSFVPQSGLRSEYLYWYLRFATPRIRALGSGTTFKEISKAVAASIWLPVPPNAEQKRIVAAIEEHFSRLDFAETALEVTRSKLQALRRSVLAAAFAGRLTNPPAAADTDLGQLPAGWEQATIGEVSNVVGGATPKTTVAANWGDGISWITPDDLSRHNGMYIERGRRSLTREGYESCSAQLMPAGSVLFSSRAPIGYVAISSGPVCTNQGFKSFVPQTGLMSKYLYWYLRFATPDIQAMGSGTTFKEISKKVALSIPLILPPIDEQEQIVIAIEEFFSRLDAAEVALEIVWSKLQAFRRAVLAEAFAGRLVPQDSDDEPAAALLARIAAERPVRPTSRKRSI